MLEWLLGWQGVAALGVVVSLRMAWLGYVFIWHLLQGRSE